MYLLHSSPVCLFLCLFLDVHFFFCWMYNRCIILQSHEIKFVVDCISIFVSIIHKWHIDPFYVFFFFPHAFNGDILCIRHIWFDIGTGLFSFLFLTCFWFKYDEYHTFYIYYGFLSFLIQLNKNDIHCSDYTFYEYMFYLINTFQSQRMYHIK